ncbi:cdc42 effector protein 5 [Leuresthes tenuis]|uniref:cdc42 effector protein 5 n=1 Tax=Leuresthes tenuis TaxID=355514 RepID=UPI003B50063C
MPLHKSTRAPRLDPTMISAPLGDFRHTMHIGRGGDTFGDTSFLSTLGPSSATADENSSGTIPADDPEVNHSDHTDALGSPHNNQLHHSDSVSSFTLDLDLDLGPSMLGDVLGVMDGLALDSNEEDVLNPQTGTSVVEVKQGKGSMEMSVSMQNELNGKNLDDNQVGDGRIPDGNGIKPKGLRPKVRFSDKREEIIRQASEEEEGQAFDFQDEDQLPCHSPTRGESERGKSLAGETEFTNHKADLPPSPASSHSSEYEGVTPLDRRRADSGHSETDSEEEEEEEEEAGRGYTFEDEFDDEIGL